MDKIDGMGGAIPAIEQGFIQKEIERRAYQIQKEIEDNKRTVVGVNEYKIEEKVDSALFKSDPAVVLRQREKLTALKESRDKRKVQAVLTAVQKAAQGEDNLMPHFIEAVRAYATLGEICDVLREVFGEYHAVGTM